MSTKAFWFGCGLTALIALAVFWVWRTTEDENTVVGATLIGGLIWTIFLVCAAIMHGRAVVGNFFTAVGKQVRVVEEEEKKQEAARKGNEHAGMVFAVWVDGHAADKQVEISWDWKGIGQLGAMFSQARIVGFRKEGGGFTAEALQEEGNGLCIVDSRQKGSKVEQDLVPGQEYFYTFFIKETRQDEGGKLKSELTDPVRFSVAIPKGVTTPPPKSKDEVELEETNERLSREVRMALNLKDAEEREVEAVEVSNASLEAKREAIEMIRGIYEQERIRRMG